jgi:hypothetical protein
MTLISLPGLWILARTSRPRATLCGGFLAIYPLMYYIVQYIERYRFPIFWVTYVLASISLRAAFEWGAETLHYSSAARRFKLS